MTLEEWYMLLWRVKHTSWFCNVNLLLHDVQKWPQIDSFRQMWDKHCKKVPKPYLLFVLSVCQHLGSFISIIVTERNKTKCTFSFLAVRKEIMLTWIELALQTEHVLGCVLCFSLSAPSVAAVSTWSRCQLGANRSFQTPTVPSFLHSQKKSLDTWVVSSSQDPCYCILGLVTLYLYNVSLRCTS